MDESVAPDPSCDADAMAIDPAIVDAIAQLQAATMGPDAVRTSAVGKAYQLVAQSAAIAVLDATDHLRNSATIASTASGVALANFMTTGDIRYAQAIVMAQESMKGAVADYQAIVAAAARTVAEFPSG
ncbi:hypothetical protein [Sphingomonas sp. 28-63-12]|uniref:hypothetical protein n=1 Tax=Sphingomonas sp. 28-63-12 TaxID=1970434 RepID=UPI0035A9474E